VPKPNTEAQRTQRSQRKPSANNRSSARIIRQPDLAFVLVFLCVLCALRASVLKSLFTVR